MASPSGVWHWMANLICGTVNPSVLAAFLTSAIVLAAAFTLAVARSNALTWGRKASFRDRSIMLWALDGFGLAIFNLSDLMFMPMLYHDGYARPYPSKCQISQLSRAGIIGPSKIEFQ